MRVRLYFGDAVKVMDWLIGKGVRVDLTVTSPPYDELRTYEGSLKWNEEIWKAIIERLYLITKQGGVVVWIVNDSTVKGSETGTSFKQALYFKEVGFNLHDTMIYKKTGVCYTHRVRYYPNFEYMFVFSKGKPKTFNPLKDRENKTNGRVVSSVQREKDGSLRPRACIGNITKKYGVRYNVWQIPHAERGAITKHPASFPRALAHDHIVSWSNEKDIVLDPLMGGGTSGEEALKLNRKFIGVEKVRKYFDLAKERIEKAV